ncbi:glycosyltransferase family 2 protein [Bradyrhizobium roseum]|uniref:glycosyltransferase family 2 protein n=1 Tax=Bradyrhizobium roseum TaxID=3056648 RepID=UPI002631999E|nr:glycosyltransferase family 2 protein [Bradyrhizobium roseus]WKA27010.1 glycosyltransferase family 2 protein [Bradyrhizobium roseus]
MKLSIVTTLYRSAAHVAEFHRRASEAARRVTDDYEIVMVDDGSPDNSLDLACALADTDLHLRVVELSRNFGHHKALMAGLDHARGELCFLIDSDLEEDPGLLGSFIDKMQATDCDVVYGFQERRKGDAFESAGGRIAWYWINKLYSIDIPQNQCTVRLMRREYVDALLLHRESNTVIGGLWVITGFRQTGSAISKGHRNDTTYSPRLRLGTLVNGITSFSTVPLNLMVMFGMTIAMISFAFGIVVILEKLIRNTAAGWASLIVSIWFMGGIIVLCLGVIGIYVSRIFVETKNRPYVIVRRIHQRSQS